MDDFLKFTLDALVPEKKFQMYELMSPEEWQEQIGTGFKKAVEEAGPLVVQRSKEQALKAVKDQVDRYFSYGGEGYKAVSEITSSLIQESTQNLNTATWRDSESMPSKATLCWVRDDYEDKPECIFLVRCQDKCVTSILFKVNLNTQIVYKAKTCSIAPTLWKPLL